MARHTLLLFASGWAFRGLHSPTRANGSIGKTPPSSLFCFRASLPVPTCYLMFPMMTRFLAILRLKAGQLESQRPCVLPTSGGSRTQESWLWALSFSS